MCTQIGKAERRIVAMLISGGLISTFSSGSAGGLVASHNASGAYLRARVSPVVSTTAAALLAKSTFGTQSARWQVLTEDERNAWEVYAQTHPRTNAIGNTTTRTGHNWFTGLNARLVRAVQPTIDIPPATAIPNGLSTLILNADIGTGTFDVAYTITPLATNSHLWVEAFVRNSAGIRFVQNNLKLILISAAAAASPIDIETELTAVFGTLQVGQTVTTVVSVIDGLSGLLSVALRADAVIVDTP